MLAEDQLERDAGLGALIERSPALADAALRRHWTLLVPWLPPAARYELAGILLEFEQACET